MSGEVRRLELQAAVPADRPRRDRLLAAVREYVSAHRPTPPLSLPQLQQHAAAALVRGGIDASHLPFALVLLNNECWREALAAVPFENRLLLLPQCLRDHKDCQGKIDEYGLLCRHCGRCEIDGLLRQAEDLGYATLVAEGAPMAAALLQSGRIQAVVGASCLPALEQIFRFIEAAACPGLAIPLTRDGCRDTTLDTDWLIEAIQLKAPSSPASLDLPALRAAVDSWFTAPALAETLGAPEDQTRQAAQEYLAAGGKRWRPLLTAAAYIALCGGSDLPAEVRAAATAVECFHKASLIHDDIEDDDAVRDGRPAPHVRLGVPMALNLGDFLIGEGYRLLADCPVAAEVRAEMLLIASGGHRLLCLGQGAELAWRRDCRLLSEQDILSIHSRKTSPAFEVALRIAAALAGAAGRYDKVLAEYCQALGIAYQIRDDIQDYESTSGGDAAAGRPSVLLAVTINEARTMLERYKRQAIDALDGLDNTALKALLRRLLAKIFDELP